MSDEDINRRVVGANPSWENYREDLKAALGPGPLAEWKGRLQQVAVQTGQVRVTFKVSGSWAGRDLQLPILMRGPDGEIYSPTLSTIQNDGCIDYLFEPSRSEEPGSWPWLLVMSPKGPQRVILPPGGVWSRERS
ncbi:MAG: hypothetical protein KJ052_17510 [Candidatus Hydrogenedentes bacterium]|nr:hypothetical protein [Candidatus Hydrogenedentota bacterium]